MHSVRGRGVELSSRAPGPLLPKAQGGCPVSRFALFGPAPQLTAYVPRLLAALSEPAFRSNTPRGPIAEGIVSLLPPHVPSSPACARLRQAERGEEPSTPASQPESRHNHENAWNLPGPPVFRRMNAYKRRSHIPVRFRPPGTRFSTRNLDRSASMESGSPDDSSGRFERSSISLEHEAPWWRRRRRWRRGGLSP